MGRVYQALDTRLGRKVANKISTTEFTDRFQREARAIAALNHPHICTLHDVGPNFLVMELVEGETLAARLKKGKLSIEDTLRYGGQIAGSLAEAHAKCVTHRDLKPGNIMIIKSGVKVLDFGLAKVEGEDLTKSNATMGTPGYMAPEQLEGKGTDARTDVMATGKREAGEEPLPPQFAHIVERCLAPEPEQRWQTASDVRAELEWAAKAQLAALVSKPNLTWQWITAACLLLVAVVVIVQFRQARQPDQSAYRLELQPPENGRFVANAIDGGIALSPDGKSAAYVAEQSGKTGLWIRPLEGTMARLLPGTEGASFPFWSPNNQSVGFFVGSRLLRSDVSGGPLVPVCDVPSGPRGGAWSDDGRTIVFGTTAVGLWQVPAAGGIASPLVGSESSGGDPILEWPQTLPRGRLLCWAYDAKRPENAGVFVTSFGKPAERTRLMSADASALYAPGVGGKPYLLWLRGSAVVAQEINLATLKLTGEPSLVADPVGALQAVGRMNAAASSTGVLLYESGGVRMAASRLTWLDRSGKPLGAVGEPGPYLNFRVSPDGSRVAVARDNSSKGADLWLLEAERGVATRFTSNPGVTFFPVWSPDGRTIVFSSTPQHLIRKPANGVGSQQSLTGPGALQNPLDWSRDGSYILYRKLGRDTQGDLWYLPVTPKGELAGDPKLYLGTRYEEFHARFFPRAESALGGV